MCQITINGQDIEYVISDMRLQMSNGNPSKTFSEQFKDYLKLYIKVEVSDPNFIPPSVFQPFYEIYIDGNLHMSGTFVERYTEDVCLIKIGEAGQNPFDMNDHTLTLKVYDSQEERKPDFVRTIDFSITI